MALTKLNHSSMPTDSVLQVIMVEKTASQQITANSTYQDVTDLTLNITPKSTSNRIIVSVHFRWGNNSSVVNYMRIMRDSTQIQEQTLGNVHYNFSNPNRAYMDTSTVHIDSPSTTSQITYKVQAKVGSGHFTFNGRGGETNDERRCQLVVMEIKG